MECSCIPNLSLLVFQFDVLLITHSHISSCWCHCWGCDWWRSADLSSDIGWNYYTCRYSLETEAHSTTIWGHNREVLYHGWLYAILDAPINQIEGITQGVIQGKWKGYPIKYFVYLWCATCFIPLFFTKQNDSGSLMLSMVIVTLNRFTGQILLANSFGHTPCWNQPLLQCVNLNHKILCTGYSSLLTWSRKVVAS